MWWSLATAKKRFSFKICCGQKLTQVWFWAMLLCVSCLKYWYFSRKGRTFLSVFKILFPQAHLLPIMLAPDISSQDENHCRTYQFLAPSDSLYQSGLSISIYIDSFLQCHFLIWTLYFNLLNKLISFGSNFAWESSLQIPPMVMLFKIACLLQEVFLCF